MGSFEDDDNRNDSNSRKNYLGVDSRDFETQQIESQYPDGDLEGDENGDFRYLTNTMPVDDSYLFDDAFETQYVNLAGETQAVDIVDETQVLDDLDFMKNMPIEFLNEFYTESVAVDKCEGANKSEAFCETQVLSQDDSMKIDDGVSVELENAVDDYPSKKESFCSGFTSIRAASMRASGLVAREHGANRNSCSTNSNKSSVEQRTCKKDGSSLSGCSSESGGKKDHEYIKDTEDLRNSNTYKVASAAVRELFKDDDVSDVGPSDTDIKDSDDTQVLASENCFAGLSYANSQEPGELSQAHALEVVDKFLDLNVMDFDERFGAVGKDAENTKVVSGSKGSRELAKKNSVLKDMDGKCGIYDWDDNREDDGGGEFFMKKKQLFFDNECPKKRSHTEPRKPKRSNFGSVKAVASNKDEKEQKCTKNKLKNLAYSDSGLMLHKLSAPGNSLNFGEKLFQKNLIKDLDEQLNETFEPNLAEEKSKDVAEMKDIGPDTQMAAEAMETLCFEVNLADGNGPDKGADCTKKESTRKNKLSNKTAHSKECLTAKRPYHASVGAVTRQTKQIKRTRVSTSKESFLSPKESDLTVSANRGSNLTGQRSEKKLHLEDRLDFSVPVAHRTRKCTALHHREEINHPISARVTRKRTAAAEINENAEKVSVKSGKKVRSDGSSALNIDAIGNLQEYRSREEHLAGHQANANTQYNGRLTRSRKLAANTSSGTRSENTLLRPNVNNSSTQIASDQTKVGVSASKQRDEEKSDADKYSDAVKADDRVEASPRAACRTSINNASPICMGDEYHSQSCRKNLCRLSLITEINNAAGSPGSCNGMKESRKRKDITSIRILFSQHLDEDVVKQQKKILARLGGAVATFMSDATHFVADEFVRTRNMLEAIASGKPVVTQLWLESCGQASCLIDVKKYILRDSRKEREFGFCLPVSLSRACQHPLLQGQKVLVTPNTKPGKAILANLVKAVHGLAVERVGRSVLKDEKLPDDLLILSCEEDYDICVPFLEKGGAVYSSELLLNGIVKQKLEYERHRIFDDHVKRTRSTIWMKKKNEYLPVPKCK